MSDTIIQTDSETQIKPSCMLLGIQMRRAQVLWRTAINEAVSELGLTEARWTVLVHLQNLGEGCSQQALANSLGIEMPSLTRTLQQLVVQDLIEKRAHEHDGRSQCLWFSAAGHRILAKLTPIIASVRQYLFSDIAADKLDILVEVMEKMEHNARKLISQSRQPNESEK